MRVCWLLVVSFLQILSGTSATRVKEPSDELVDALFLQDSQSPTQVLSQHFPSSLSLGPNQQIGNSSILILSFASENIMSYALPALFVNHLYAFHRNHSFHFLHEGNNGDSFPQDRRWNKIAAIINAIESDWGRDYPVLVSHDADLIFTDFTFDLHQLLAEHPHAQVILSSDAFDLANSGFILLRNTKWSYQFFLTWYSARFAHPSDQQALNALIQQMKSSKSFQKKFLILPKGLFSSPLLSACTLSLLFLLPSCH
jgi:hypothetical protein